MGPAIAVKAQETDEEKKVTSANTGSRIRFSWILAASMIAALWFWAAFFRALQHSIIPKLLTITFLWAAVSIVNLVFASRGNGNFFQPGQRAAVACAAFFLPAVFLPEYLLGGNPVLLRSIALLLLTLLLYGFFAMLFVPQFCSSLREMVTQAKWSRALILFCIIYLLGVTLITIIKLRAFGYIGQDIGYFTQCLHTALHGRLFYSNLYHDLLYGKPISSDFAAHNQLVLYVFLAFYVIHKAASTMLVARNIMVVLCAWPVYLLSRRILPRGLAALLTIAFLLVPAILYQNVYDFAPLSAAGLPLLFAFYFFAEERFVPFLISLVFTQVVREDLVFAVFGFGLLSLWYRRTPKWFVIPGVLAVSWAIFSWKILFPHFLAGTTSVVNGCFSHLGATPSQMLHRIISKPQTIATRENLIYVKQLVGPWGGILFLLNPSWLVSLPYIGINVMGQGGACNTAMVYRHYAMVPSVLLFVGFLFTIERLTVLLRRKEQDPLPIQAALVSLAVALAFASLLFVTGQQQFRELESQAWHTEARSLVGKIPVNSSVAVPRYLLPSFASRNEVYMTLRLLEYHHPDPEFIVIDKDWSREHATERWRDNYLGLLDNLKNNPRYTAVYDSSNYLIYRRCAGCSSGLPHAEIVNE